MLMLLAPRFATATSSLPSPLKSPTATPTGVVPVALSVLGRTVPSPLPSSTLSVLEFELMTARSALPSPLKSPTAAPTGTEPTVKLGDVKKLGTVRSSNRSTASEFHLPRDRVAGWELGRTRRRDKC